MNTADDRAKILTALDKWTRQRPGLDFGNYGCPRAYRSELRAITRDFRDAQTLLHHVELSGLTAEDLRDAFRAYSGRLSWDGARLSYVTGQYWPTEYRKAVCAVLASALWRHHARDVPTDGADQLRAKFRRMFGRGVASRWFN